MHRKAAATQQPVVDAPVVNKQGGRDVPVHAVPASCLGRTYTAGMAAENFAWSAWRQSSSAVVLCVA